MTGTLINVAAILLGGFLGILLKKGIPERINTTITQGMSLGIMIIGITMAIVTEHVLVMIISIALGGVVGELINIERRLNNLGDWAQGMLKDKGDGNFSEAFVTASLLYCTGSMAIMGSIENGISGAVTILATKALLDGIFAIIIGSTLGPGVLFSVVPVFVYQGSITLAARYLEPLLSAAMINEMNAVGGVLMLGIGINMMKIKEIKLGNLIPAIFMPILLLALMSLF